MGLAVPRYSPNQSLVGLNYTDRGNGGVKCHVLTETQGLPIGVAVTGPNVHEATQVQAVLEFMPVLPHRSKAILPRLLR